jgi:hypothetical protein
VTVDAPAPMRLQTDPYLTLLSPDRPPPVVYMTDTLGPTYPDMTEAPPDAAFGIVDLHRKVTWEVDLVGVEVLDDAAKAPVDAGALEARHGPEVVRRMVRAGWLQAPDDLCRDYLLRTAQIEITAHCNWGCQYCPVATDPKPRKVMSMALFEEVVAKLEPHPDIKYVTFHFFNEPSLDPHFIERVDVLARHGQRLSLASNMSALTPKKLTALVSSGVLHHLVVNLPSVDEDELRVATRSPNPRATLSNLDAAVAAGLPITIAVNGQGPSLARNLAAVRDRYEPRGVEVVAPLTCDRAGEVGGGFGQGIHIAGRLTGCSWPVNHAYVSVAGDLFICCNDYYQREVFGHISDGTLDEIFTGDAAVALRRRVFGVDRAPIDFPCRRCHDQLLDFPHRQFRPAATFPFEAPGARG